MNFQSDFKKINSALLKASKNQDFITHFIFAISDGNHIDRFVSISDGMKKYRIKTAIVTNISMCRHDLVTKETMVDFHKGKFKNVLNESSKFLRREMCESVNDDLGILLDEIQLGQVKASSVHTFCFRKLTDAEMRLLVLSDEDYLQSFIFSRPYLNYLFGESNILERVDVNKEEMELSESKSKFVRVNCKRYTDVIQNRPINGYFKRSIKHCEKCEDQPRSKFRIYTCNSCKSAFAYPV